MSSLITIRVIFHIFSIKREVTLFFIILLTYNSLTFGEQIPADVTIYPALNRQYIDKIIIVVSDVFDTNNPKENKSFYRLANSAHINTREGTIRGLLLFKTGDVISLRRLAETERILRQQAYLYEAKILPINIRDDKVDIQVNVRDVWTLTTSINYSRAGGKNKSSFAISESNMLGYGKQIQFRIKNNYLRTEQNFKYHDPNVAGTRHVLSIKYSSNSDGNAAGFDYSLPFYSLDTIRSYGISFLSKENQEFITLSDGLISQIGHRDDIYELFAGRAHPLSNHRVTRVKFGFTYDQHRFTMSDKSLQRPLPDDTRDSYPWIGFAYIEDRFITMRRIHFLDKTEDINLGDDVDVRIGMSNQNYGGKSNSILIRSKYQYRKLMNNGALFSQNLFFSGRFKSSAWVDSIISSETNYHQKSSVDVSNFAGIKIDMGRLLSPDKTLHLGGETGMRGYPLHYKYGDKRVVMTFEKRFYTDRQILQLAHVSGFVFMDVGQTWQQNNISSGRQGVLSDIGIGLRMSPSKSSENSVVRFELAFPLSGKDSSVGNYQFNITSKSLF